MHNFLLCNLISVIWLDESSSSEGNVCTQQEEAMRDKDSCIFNISKYTSVEKIFSSVGENNGISEWHSTCKLVL